MPQTIATIDSRLSHERRAVPRPLQRTAKRLIHLAEENARLERTVAELRLRNILLEEALNRRS
jgi:hypothetical protein